MESVTISPLSVALFVVIFTAISGTIGHLVRQGNQKTDEMLVKIDAAEKIRAEESKAQAALNATTNEILSRLADDTRDNRRRHDSLDAEFRQHILEGANRRIRELEHENAELRRPPSPD